MPPFFKTWELFTQCHIQEEFNLQQHCCENLKPHITVSSYSWIPQILVWWYFICICCWFPLNQHADCYLLRLQNFVLIIANLFVIMYILIIFKLYTVGEPVVVTGNAHLNSEMTRYDLCSIIMEDQLSDKTSNASVCTLC